MLSHLLVHAIAFINVLAASGPEETATPPFKIDATLYLPLRLHVLAAKDLPLVHSELADEELQRRVAGVRRIWRQAGVEVYIESTVREPAANQARFKLAVGLDAVQLGSYEGLPPDGTRSEEALDVYFVKELPVNGVFFARRACVFVKEKPSLEPVPGGTDFPPERVLAHEIGHYLGLEHVAGRSLLMARGTTGFGLDAAMVKSARKTAADRKPVLTPEYLVEKAEAEIKAGKAAAARPRLESLARTPGESVVKAKAEALLKGLKAP